MDYSFKCFGNGASIKIIELNPTLHQKITQELSTEISLTEILFNLEILESLNICNWENQKGIITTNLFKLEKRGKIEIKQRNKKILKKPSTELINVNTLFPLYNIKNVNFNINRKPDHFYIIAGYYTTGLISSMTITSTENFNIDLLDFHLVEFPLGKGFLYLTQVSYNENEIALSGDDFVIRGCFAEWF